MEWREPCAMAEDDPLRLALKERRARQAWRLLRRRERLSWTETSIYAPLALGWAPRLLEMILDLGPREEVFCRHTLLSPSGNWEIILTAPLLTAAAARDDLAAVELLLARGYRAGRAGGGPELLRQADLTAWYRLLSAGQGHGYIYDVNHFYCIPNPFPNNCSCGRIDCDALSIALELGNLRCALRLLPERAEELSLASRLALRRGCYVGLEEMSGGMTEELAERAAEEERRRRAAAGAVLAVYGDRLDLGACLDREELKQLCRREPLFQSTLERHPEWIGAKQAGALAALAGERPWALELLKRAPSEAVIDWSERMLFHGWEKWEEAGRCLDFRLPLRRQAVPEQLEVPPLELLERAEIIGEPPEGGLSGLAAFLLSQILHGCQTEPGPQVWSQNRLLRYPKTIPLLREEDPAMVMDYLRWRAEQWGIPARISGLLAALLDLKQEDERYVL